MQEAKGKVSDRTRRGEIGCVATDAHEVPRAVTRYGNSLLVRIIAPFDSPKNPTPTPLPCFETPANYATQLAQRLILLIHPVFTTGFQLLNRFIGFSFLFPFYSVSPSCLLFLAAAHCGYLCKFIIL